MKAFVTSLFALVLISVTAAVGLGLVPSSTKESFTSHNVRH